MAFLVQKDVIGLKVAVDDVTAVEFFQCHDDFCEIHAASFLGEAALLLQTAPQVSSRTEVEDHEQSVGVLEGEVQADDERMVDRAQHALFGQRVSL